MKKIVEKVKKMKGKLMAFCALAIGAVAAGSNVIAKAEETTATDAVKINFETTKLFEYANVIISALMPVVYITAGLALGFTIIYALKNAFSR